MSRRSVKEETEEQERVMTKRRNFLRAVAEYLADNQAGKSIALEIEQRAPKPDPVPNWAREWAKVCGRSPLFGYPTVDEAEQQLCEMFGVTYFNAP